MDPRQFAFTRYVAEFDHFEKAADAAEELLKNACRSAGLRPDVKVRAKEVASFIKKMHVKHYADPWTETTDKVGGRIITETLEDLDKVLKFFDNPVGNVLMEVLSIEKKSDSEEAYSLYYPGIHVQVVVPRISTSDGEPIQCEIQLRTKAQDAWASAAHGRLYKGVISPSKRTARRLYRLSVLTEMFDEEVRTAMNEIQSEPGYENAVLLNTVEALFLPIAGQPGEDALSLEMFKLLGTVLDQRERQEYIGQLTDFVSANSKKIKGIIEDFGPSSEFAQDWSYWLFSQPELLVLFEMIDKSPMALSSVVSGSEIERAVAKIYEAWGTLMPIVDQ